MSSYPPRNRAGYFGLLSGTVGLILCIAQTYKSHVDGENEREMMQEMHEQKMHYLHEFHRQELRSKDHHITALEAEARAREAERLAGMYSEKAWEGMRRGVRGRASEVEAVGDSKVVVDGVAKIPDRELEKEKEGEVWRLMSMATEQDVVGVGRGSDKGAGTGDEGGGS